MHPAKWGLESRFLTPDRILSSTAFWWVLKIIVHGLYLEVT